MGIVLITSQGRQIGLLQSDTGVKLIVTSPAIASPEDKALLEQAVEYPAEMTQASIAGGFHLSPGAS